MEAHADFHDWEILLGPELDGGDLEPLEASECHYEDGVVKSDYFALDSLKPYHKGAALAGNALKVEEKGWVDSDNPSSVSVDPESDCRFLDRPKEEVGFLGIEYPPRELSALWSDESSDGQRSQLGSEKGELGDTGGLEIEARADGDEKGVKEVGFDGTGEIEGREMSYERPCEEVSGEHVKTSDENYNFSPKLGDKNIGSEGDLAGGGEKSGVVWWKLPFELLRVCAFKVKPVWSISIAAAILGVWMLGKRLYRMKHKTRTIPLKLSLDEKKASQLKMQVARLNEAFTVVRRVPIVRASLPAVGGLTPRSAMGF